MRLGPRATERTAGAEEVAHFVGRCLVALEVLRGGKERAEADQIRNAVVAGCEVGAGVGISEAKRALAKVVAHAEQVVDLGEAALARPFCLGAVALVAVDQSPTPTVRGAVGEGTEH